jgi:DeoR family transcriptional regulator of aga operon/DeoR family fructose operon transcriptional repressor
MSLPKAERKERIRQHIEGKIHVTVSKLCEFFKVSEATIRRDLEELESEHLIKRTHGGASPITPPARQTEIYRRKLDQQIEKEAIARSAAELVQDGDTIFIGSGSSTQAITKYLRTKKNLTVITNSLPVINDLIDFDEVKVIVTGGWLRKSELSLLGHISEMSLEELRADKVILGSEAIHPEEGLTNSYLPETRTDRAIIGLSAQVIIVADHTKFCKVKPAYWAPLDTIDTIVCDWKVPPATIALLKSKKVRVVVAQTES